ncbi:hypothetical protein POTOM_044734 [Populus tomentosa]|uniref:S-locus glycoprotein domain-containing protein n=1 Tax=Populus tomentosa TaxID=118781 RepID=A0A8X8C884_POPTO|nr:hypothetical protein POTOM_044734 [Populus tomentosa]
MHSSYALLARDTITTNSLLGDDEVEKLLFQQAKIEKRKGFELGFFTLEENPVYRSYVGIGIRPLLDIRGELQYWSFDVYTIWSLQWWERRDKCSVLIARGNDGSCNLYNKLACKCLPGFKPKSPENWNSGDFSGGCIRSSDERGKNDTFLSLKMTSVTGNGTEKCLCNSNFQRDYIALTALKLRTLPHAPNCRVVDRKSGGSSTNKKPLSLIAGVTMSSVTVLSSIDLYICILMRKKAKRRALLDGTEKRVRNLIDAEELKEEDKKGIDTGSIYYTRMVKEEREAVRFSIDFESSPGKQTEDRTQRGVGTRGYTSPEYALDVFSFGLVVLGTLHGGCGKRKRYCMDRELCETCDAKEFVKLHLY